MILFLFIDIFLFVGLVYVVKHQVELTYKYNNMVDAQEDLTRRIMYLERPIIAPQAMMAGTSYANGTIYTGTKQFEEV